MQLHTTLCRPLWPRIWPLICISTVNTIMPNYDCQDTIMNNQTPVTILLLSRVWYQDALQCCHHLQITQYFNEFFFDGVKTGIAAVKISNINSLSNISFATIIINIFKSRIPFCSHTCWFRQKKKSFRMAITERENLQGQNLSKLDSWRDYWRYLILMIHVVVIMIASVAQLDANPTGDKRVAGSILVGSGSIFLFRLITKYLLRSFAPFHWFKKSICQFLAKECAQYWLTT